MTDVPAINLHDPSLFGNDAAEDEAEAVFQSYFVDRPEIAEFIKDNVQFQVLRAYRGEGKSAILRKAFEKIREKEAVAVKTTGSSLSPDINSSDPSAWIKGWKRQILSLFASEIGSQIGMAWSDDATSLVEEAERNGFKARSFISSILDRLPISKVPQRKLLGAANPEKLMQRWMQGRPEIWLFVDDVDENFVNTPESRAKVASFFSACRQIMNLIPEIRIRSGIRPNVWQIVRSDAESLSKVEQYVLDIRWDIPQLRAMLARRVEGYLRRTLQDAVLAKINQSSGQYRDEQLIALVFDEQMEWGFNKELQKPIYRPPHVIMATLSRNRPRWMIELSKLASKQATSQKARIFKNNIVDVLEGFGKARIDDLAAEYRSECAQIREVINAFSDGAEDFTTANLQTLIEKRILTHLDLTFASFGRPQRSMQIAAFLYEIGFLTAREELPDGSYRHFTFAEQPELLHNRTNTDRGMTWEIHPVFRQALGLRTDGGRKKDNRKRK